MSDYPDTLLFIGGNWRDARSGEWLAVLNPATAQQIGRVAKAGRADLEDAAASASSGFEIWRRTSAYDRAAILRKAATLLRVRAADIAANMVREQGKPLAQALGETMFSADVIEWFAGEAQRAYGQVIPARQTGVLQLTQKLPVGPVAAFSPWNFPINQAARKLAAALAAGCSVILKAAEETPASPAALVQCFADAGVPAGAINLVYGEPAEISSFLIAHPSIRKVTFTGSTAVGKQLASLAGQYMKRATMELGGHSPVIVTEDADRHLALDLMVPHKFRNAGQVCVSPTRFIVQKNLVAQFAAVFAERSETIRVGDGLDPATEMGPLANERRIAAMDMLVSDAVAKGARVLTGGRRLRNDGWFYEPTVLADVPVDARIMNEEPFGPVALINTYDSLDEAIYEANRLPFGLAAYAFSGSGSAITRMGEEIEAGMLSVNHLGLAWPETPFGGLKESGYGTEGGSDALAAYLDTRFVTRKG